MESTGSRVVPGVSLTTTRSSLSRRFTSDDLPTFGRPTIATGSLLGHAPRPSAARARPSGEPLDDHVEQIADACRHARRPPGRVARSPAHRTRRRAPARACRRVLLMASTTGCPLWRSVEAISSSPGTSPRGRRRRRPAGRPTRRRGCPWLDHELMQRVLARAEHAAGVDEREADTLPLGFGGDDVARGAGNGATIARRVPVIRLKSVDLPTLGRPTRTTDGSPAVMCDGMEWACSVFGHLRGGLTA